MEFLLFEGFKSCFKTGGLVKRAMAFKAEELETKGELE